TKLVIWISDTLSSSPLLVFASLIGFVFLMRAVIRAERMQPLLDMLVLRLPVVGNIIREMNSARTARTLSSLLASGVDVIRALQITKDVVQNTHYKNLIQKAVDSVQKGVPLSSIFKERVDLYPVMVGEMMEVGEETGKFGDMLLDIANFYEAEVEAKTKDLSTIVEPVLMILIGAAVGFFAVSMITPMYSLMDTIG
ncbi:MAG: type pilus assembly protein PilC, partial [Patescibacteria group bacterium]|nr:type pilus assembly protein PilC [Patescibacteria group bacterium]